MYVRIHILQVKFTPLHSAAEEGHITIVEFLIHLGADVNAITIVS